jgi:internalin A
MSYKIALQRINEWKDGTPLNLSNLGLDKIPKEISALTHLKWLYLDNNRITEVKPLASLTLLEYLYVSNNKVQDIASLASLTNCKVCY